MPKAYGIKSEVLWSTCRGNILKSWWEPIGNLKGNLVGTHWELKGKNIVGTHWELKGKNIVGTHWELKGKHSGNPLGT